MPFRYVTFAGGLAVVLSLGTGQVAAQSQPVNAKAKAPGQTWKAPRTANGQPDFQGVWANNNATPLERPKELEGRALLTDEELAAMKQKSAELFNGESDAAFGDNVFTAVLANVLGTKKGFKSTDGQTGDYSSVWTVQRDWDNRTSLITDPSDGRLPALTPEAKMRRGGGSNGDEGQRTLQRRPSGPEDLALSLRCITMGSPRLQAGYNSYYEILQTPKVVSIHTEMIHDTRMVPLDGSPHLPSNVKLWMGDARGHFEGDTLVIDTTNYKPGAFRSGGGAGGSSDQLHTIERLTRVSPEILQYQVTIDDPATWTKPWTVMIPLHHSKDAVYEYACHEGNIAMSGTLAGARADDKADALAKAASAK